MTTTTTITSEAPQLSITATDAHVTQKSEGETIERGIVIPQFTDKYAERKWAKEHMAGAFRVFAKLGFNDGVGGHFSLRDLV